MNASAARRAPARDRRASEHPRRGKSAFSAFYAGTPPWDIDTPQPAFIRAARRGEIRGRVLDAGCGTGENTLYLASRGYEVWGLDFIPEAVDKARAKARVRGSRATFVIHNALRLHSLGRTFDTIIDSGLFHVFTDRERVRYETGLRSVLKRGGTYFLLCFSDAEPDPRGPRHVSEGDIRTVFSTGWKINYLRPDRFKNRIRARGARAWFASITRR